MNSKLFGMLLVVAAAASALISTQNALASICPPMCVADIAEEEAAEVENPTMTNQSAEGI